MRDSKVAWCHDTWNPWLGCTPCGLECRACYAKTIIENKKGDFSRLLPTTSTWSAPYTLNARAGRLGQTAFIFSASMSDWFHQDADQWRDDAWRVVRDCQRLTWLIPTKRSERILDHLPADWEENFQHVWLGATCGVRSAFNRVNDLRKVPCTKRFLSIEPLMEDISDIDLSGIGWVLVGGMSGDQSGKYPMKIEWAASLYDVTRQTGTPYFFKQVSHRKNEWVSNALGMYLAERDGREADPATVDLVRECPDTRLPLMPLNREKGHRFILDEWQAYRSLKDLTLNTSQGRPNASLQDVHILPQMPVCEEVVKDMSELFWRVAIQPHINRSGDTTTVNTL